MYQIVRSKAVTINGVSVWMIENTPGVRRSCATLELAVTTAASLNEKCAEDETYFVTQ